MKPPKILFNLLLAFAASILLFIMSIAPVSAGTGAISLSPTSGTDGTTVSISGSGFTAGSSYSIFFDTLAVSSGTISSGGTLATTFTVPPYPRGTHPVTVVTDAPDNSNSVDFTTIPNITSDADSGEVGSQLMISGTSFDPSSTVGIYFDDANVLNVTSDTSGSFTRAIFTVPPSYRGTHTIRATDGFSVSTIAFIVLPSVTLSHSPDSVGSQTTVTGTGFAVNSSITFLVDEVIVPSSPTSTNSFGSFNSSFTVPLISRGSHILKVRDGNYNSATVNFTIRQSIAINPQSGLAGTTVTITGNGFGANKRISVSYNGVSISTDPPEINTDDKGSFSASISVPAGRGGVNTIEASDGTYSINAVFNILASASLSPASGNVGSDVTIKGTSFGSNGKITIKYDGVQVATATADANGSFSATFKAPASTNGNHTVTVSDNANSASLIFAIIASAIPSPISGNTGSDVAIKGSGFTSNKTVIIRYDGMQVATATADANGSFSAAFKAPVSQGGNHTLTVSDDTNTASSVFTVTASASLSPASGNVGSDVTVKGTGFTSSGTVIIKYDGGQVATATADANGSFSAAFKAPVSKSGNHAVTANDNSNTASTAFTVTASASLSPASGNVGSDVTVKGTGFTSSGTVIIRYDGGQVATATSDANGSFSASFKAPVSKSGSHAVIATDGANSVSSIFSMDSTPPPVPVLVEPANNSSANALTSFGWTAVNDPSGVTYALEVASDNSFSAIIVEKTGLTAPEYTLTEQEKLKSVSKQNPYYWRVKAIDRASNESQWTQIQSFHVGFVLSTWALYTLIGIAALLVIILGFWLGRRNIR